MTKKPSYRFVGFEDEWKEVKLGEILVERNEQISENEEYQLMSFVQGKGVVAKSDRYDRSFLVKDDKKNYKKTEFGDFIYSSNNLDTGSIGFNKSGKALISPVYSIFYSKTKKESQFIAILSQRKEFINEMIKYRQGVVYGQFRIHESDFLNISILAPESNAQEALINFFQYIDQLINLQQRKLEVLKEQKKTYLKLLFPAKCQTKPALRFAGFEDEWKEVKLGDLILRGGSGGTPKSTVAKYYGGDIPFLSITDISNSGKYLKRTEKTITNEGLQNSSAWVVPEGAISLAMYASVGKLAILGIDCATSQAFYNMVFEDDIVRNFVYITLEKANIYNEWGSLISTGTQANLNAEKVKNFSFLHPRKPEQEVIGTFFQDLDKAIAKQEEKVNQLKESKQTLLRKMFI